MEKRQSDQLNGAAIALLAVGLVVAILLNTVLGVILAVAGGALFVFGITRRT